MRRIRCFLLMICIFFCYLLTSGCSSASSDSPASEVPAYSPDHLFIPEAPGSETIGYAPLILDISNTQQGYFIAQADASVSKVHIQILSPDQVTYSYFVDGGTEAVIPFTSGNGTYSVTCYQQIQQDQYAALFLENIDVTLDNEFYPFLYSNQYVSFSENSKAVQTARSLISPDASDIEVLDAIYTYVVETISYDMEKAASIEAGYLPNIDDTLETQKGICFDYAALMAAMLRSRNVPCKLQIGYSGSIKHAWIDVYIHSKGWVSKAIAFDENTWTRMDPTFDSSAEDKDSILSYIGDGANYTVQFTR